MTNIISHIGATEDQTESDIFCPGKPVKLTGLPGQNMSDYQASIYLTKTSRSDKRQKIEFSSEFTCPKSKMAGLDEGQQQTPEIILFQGHRTYLLNDLITFDRAFFIGCIDKPRTTIQKKNIPGDQYWFATYSKRNDTWSPATPENCKANVLICEEWVHNNLPKFTGDETVYKYKPLPALIQLEEHEKFIDQAGNVYEVEVRGVKSETGIRFKCKDVCNVFEMETLDTNIARMLDQTEYEIFCSGDPIKLMGSPEQNMSNSKTTYLTYEGLLKIIYRSNSGVAKKFRSWASKMIYAAHVGGAEEKINVAAAVVDTDVENMRKYYEEKLKLKDQDFEEQLKLKDQDLEDKELKLKETERHTSVIQELMMNNTKTEPTQVVYIATSQSYANQNRFKVGGVESVNKLKSRLSTYNSRSAEGDDFYYSDIFIVADYRQIETRLKSLMLRFRDRANKEIYILHYSNIQYIVMYLCDRYNEELDYVNEHLLKFIESLNRYTLRPVVPEKTSFNHASITSCQEDGSVHVSTIQTNNTSELVKRIEEYVEGLNCTEISKKEVFDKLGIKKGRRELLPLVRRVMFAKRPDVVLINIKK